LGSLVNGKVYGLCILGNYAYIAHDDLGIQIIDISDPQLPIVLGCADTPFDIHRVTVSGNYVYASGVGYGFSTIDVSNPTEPNLIGVNDSNDFIQDLLVYGNYLYVNDFSFGGLRIYDISDPVSPILAGSYQPSNYMITSRIKITDHRLYLTSSKFEILDITDPSNPGLIGSIDGFFGGKAIDVTDNYAYAVTDTALLIIDISDRTIPHLAGNISHMGLSDIYISGDNMYLIGEAPGLKMYNISDRIHPQLIASYYTAQPLIEIEMKQDNIYIAGLHSLLTLRLNPTDINYDSNPIPSTFSLSQNYPNPFNPTTIISYNLPKSAHVKLEILDILGREIKTLIYVKQEAGHHTIIWDGKGNSSGIYFYKIEAGNFTETRKMVLLK
jgi:hypothetical protein